MKLPKPSQYFTGYSRRSALLSWLPAASLLAAPLLHTGCAPLTFGPALKDHLIKEIGTTLQRTAYADGVDFAKWPDYARKHAEAIDNAESPLEFTKVVNDALGEFGVSHLNLYTPRQGRDRKTGKFSGLGITLQEVDGGFLACHVIRDGPAYKAGIRNADLLTIVDGEPLTNVDVLRGEPGETRTLTWLRDGQSFQATVKLDTHRRATPDEITWLSDEIVMISVHSFISKLYQRKQIEDFFERAAGAETMILDLRSNRGGRLSNTRHLLGQLLPRSTQIFGDVYKSTFERYKKKYPDGPTDAASIVARLVRWYKPIRGRRHKTPFEGRLFVLIDSQAGSGGDLVPAVLQEQERGTLVGVQTMGKVRLGTRKSLSRGYQLQIPIGELVTGKGRSLEGNGAEPDISLSHEQTADTDSILAAVMKIIEAQQPSP
ncbi:MAG: S41 family peptidase [Planctomycetota bacterium]|jgi:C-terminal processing protease CtpA/Prc